jgi:predicted nucleotidyltransferase
VELSRPLATITPTLDGDVLTVLANHDVTFTTGQLRRVLARHSEEGIRKVLRRLARQGVVRSDRIGNAFAYRLNRDHLAAEYIIGLSQLKETLLKRIEARLDAWQIPPLYAAVFGSAARGTMTADSDLDLLLIRPDGVDRGVWDFQVDELVVDVTRWIGNDTRPLEFAHTELIDRGRHEPVLADVLNDGITLIGDRAWLAKQLQERKGPRAV